MLKMWLDQAEMLLQLEREMRLLEREILRHQDSVEMLELAKVRIAVKTERN